MRYGRRSLSGSRSIRSATSRRPDQRSSALLISISRFSTSVTSSDRSTPFYSALPEKYSQTLRSIETGNKTPLPEGM